ncbi:hypothetical protein SLA2020_234120 [Shorea laevis]
MEQEANSWIRRTNFSHTVCHRLDATRLASFPITIEPDRNPGLKSRPAAAPSKKTSVHGNSEIQRNPITNKQRTVSPLPHRSVPDVFKEARSDRKRFSTPHPRRKESDRGIIGKLLHKDSQEAKASNSFASNTSPLRHLGTMKIQERMKARKESAWLKYFDHAGGKVTAVGAADEQTVDLSKLFLGLRFAHGAHSRLYHGIYKDEPVAVKIITVPDDDENGNLRTRLEKQFNREVTLLSRLHHQKVIKFVAACKKPPVYCVITEYLSEGSLRAYLHKLDHKSLPLQKLIAIALDIAHGMEYIHSKGVIHRDLKPENILIDENFHLKVADFGIACEEAYCDLLADDPGTYRWMAPEMIKKKSYGQKVDVYSFGLILWEMVAGTIPYDDMNPIQAAFAVVNKNLRPVIPGDCPPPLRALIEQCWSLQPDKRPDFSQIVQVLERFESALNHDGTLNLVQNLICQDHKKGFLHWIQKLGPIHPHTQGSPMPKPKFT